MTDVLDEIAREVKDNKVVVYMKGTPSFPMCGFSAATVQVLREVGVPFKAIDVLAEPEKREAIKRFSNWPTIPQVYVGGKFIGGCDIVREMHARGELAPLLRAAAFGGKTLIEQHQMIYGVLGTLMPEIHALSLRTAVA